MGQGLTTREVTSLAIAGRFYQSQCNLAGQSYDRPWTDSVHGQLVSLVKTVFHSTERKRVEINAVVVLRRARVVPRKQLNFHKVDSLLDYANVQAESNPTIIVFTEPI